jgi:lysozyme
MRTLLDWIKHHEGLRLFPYQCTANKTTIGWGRNLQDNGISVDEAEILLNNDIKKCVSELSNFDWFTDQPEQVRWALINMCFNLGLPRLLGFKKMIAALKRKDYTQAAIEALDSRWSVQVGQRSNDVALMIRQGNDAPRS